MKGKIGHRLLSSVTPREECYEIWDSEISGFVLRVHPTGKKTYSVSYRRRKNGRRTRFTIGDAAVISPAQAKDLARIALGKVSQGTDPSEEKKRSQIKSLNNFVDDYYKTWIVSHKKSGEATISRLKACFPELLNLPLSEITPWLVDKWRSNRKKSGIKATTINRDVGCLKTSLSLAVKWGMIDSNPLADVRPLKTDSNPVVRFLSFEEEEALRDAMDKRERKIRIERDSANRWRCIRSQKTLPDLKDLIFVDHLKPMVILAMLTGMRRGELFNLRWEKVDLNRRSLEVEGATTKNGNTRHIPLNVEATNTLRSWWEQNKRPTEGIVFPGRDKKSRLQDIKHSWSRVLKDAHIENFRWHDLRHHFASQLVMAGVDLNTVRELLGHKDIKMVLRYAHLAPHIKAEAVSRLDQLSARRNHG